ncbi:MAG: hypothetical protein WB952_11940 [Terriglobales bacterium]
MMTPSPVSGAPYQTTTLSEDRSNYLRGSLLFNSAYSDNASVSSTGRPLSDVNYSIWPSIALDETTTRLHTVFSYSPGFTLYQRMSSLDQMDQNFNLSVQYRLSPHVTLSLRDSLQKTSSAFNQPDLLAATPVSGSAQAPGVSVIAPGADQLRNLGDVELTYQFSAASMIGGSGTFTNLHYPNSSQVPGLFDSSGIGGSFFYTRRFSKKHYLGTTYQYQRIAAYPVGPENLMQTQAILGFYTIALKPTLSLSISGGAQHSELEQAPLPPSRSWSPVEIVSLGWRARRTSLAASYMHVVSGGGGLVGAFHSSAANASIRQQLSKRWTVGATGGYSIYKTVNPLFSLSGSGGHSIIGTVSLQHQWRDLQVEAEYTRLHQSYAGIAVVSTAPDTNRESISVSYQFSKALGR